MSKSVRRIFTAALGGLSALLISTGVCAFTTLFNNGLQASAQERDGSAAAITADGQTITWTFFDRETENNSASIEYYAGADRIPLLAASCDGTAISAEDLTVTDESGETVTEAVNAGTYTFTYTGEAEYSNPVFTLEITPIRVNLGDFDTMAWELASHSTLQSGKIYQYSYKPSNANEVQFYYSATEVAVSPNSDWSDWQLVDSSNVNCSIVGYKTSDTERSIRLNNDQAIENYLYTAEYSGDFKATTAGEYTAKAILTPRENHEFYIDESGSGMTMKNRGLTVTIEKDGNARVTKTWYIAYYTNVFLDVSSKDEGVEREVPYQMPSWNFGEFPTGKVNTPLLQHGDEMYVDNYKIQPSGYEMYVDNSLIVNFSHNGTAVDGKVEWSGGEDWLNRNKDTVTFTIKRGDTVICENQPRIYWIHYINEYTPVGSYTVTFSAVTVGLHIHTHWWNGIKSDTKSITEYSGIANTYSFEVREGRLGINDSSFNAAVNSDAKSYEVNINTVAEDCSNLFNVILSEVSYPEYVITRAEVAQKGRYWADYADVYYDEAPLLSFNLARMYNSVYYTADAEEWKNIITAPGNYKVFYRAAMRNYDFYPAVADRENYYFSVTLYEEVEEPSLLIDKFTYNGSAFVAAVATDSRYKISENVQTNAGNYKAKLELTDPAVYRWKNGGDEDNDAVTWLYYVINPATITKPVLNARDYTGNPQQPDVTIMSDAFGKPLYAVVDASGFENGYTDAGPYQIQLKLTDPANYIWVNDDNTPAEEATKDGRIEITFVINRLQNRWIRQVSVKNWEWETFSVDVNTFNATCLTTEAIEYYVTRDAAGNSKISGLENFTAVNGVVSDEVGEVLHGLPCGSYYLWGKVEPTRNYTELKPVSHKFEVVKAHNGWITEPSIVQWPDGAAPNLPTAAAIHGEVQFEIVSETGSAGIVYSTEKKINVLATAEAGEYILTAWVNENSNYAGIPKVNKSFRIFPPSTGNWNIFPSIENWAEDQTPSNPVGEASAEGADVVFTYRTAAGQMLGTVKPLTAGDYVLIATAYVDGNEVARAEYSFKVLPKALLKNEWVVEPSIENWTEGGKASEPHGEAKVGELTFSYKTAKGELLSEKPTATGNYLLVATVEAEGYETLVKEIPFTITVQSGMDLSAIVVIAVLAVAVVALSTTMAVVIVKSKNKKKHQ